MTEAPIDIDRIALGVRQPWASLILEGEKTIEVRSQPTRVRGPIYIYASKKPCRSVAAQAAAARYPIDQNGWSTGLLIGSVELVNCRRAVREDSHASCVPPADLVDHFAWELAEPRPLPEPIRPEFLPYGVWFYPFQRRGSRNA